MQQEEPKYYGQCMWSFCDTGVTGSSLSVDTLFVKTWSLNPIKIKFTIGKFKNQTTTTITYHEILFGSLASKGTGVGRQARTLRGE